MDDQVIQELYSLLTLHRERLSYLFQQLRIFGAHAPFYIIYDINRTQEEIRRYKMELRSRGEVIEDLPNDETPAEPCTNNIYHDYGRVEIDQVPEPVGDFIGREREVAEICKVLNTASVRDTTTAIALLIGMGGMGKTELARVVASKLKAHFPDAQVIIELHGASETPLTAEQALQRAIRAFDIHAQLPDKLEELTILYRSLLIGKRVLILADDAKDRAQVRGLKPPAGSALLITSRLRFTLPGMVLYDVGTLAKAAAAKLLRTIYPQIGTYAPRLAQLCGYLPLALRVSASTLASIPAARAEIDDYISRLERERMQHLRDLDEPDDPQASVKASLALSHSMLSPDAQRALGCLSIFPAPFDHPAAHAVAQVDATQYDFGRDPISQLRRHSLLQQKAERLSLHDLVRVFAQPSNKDATVGARRRYISHYADLAERAGQLPPQQRHKALELFRLNWTHIETGWTWASEQLEACALWRSYVVAALPVFDRFCARAKRSQLLERAYEIAVQTEDLALQARLLIGLGDTTVQMGTRDTPGVLNRSESYYQTAQSIAEVIDRAVADGAHAPDGLDERVISCRAAIGLGMVSARRGERQLAIQHYLHGLALTRATHNHDDACLALSNLGNALVEDGRVEEAIGRYCMGIAQAQQIKDQRIGVKLLRDLGAAYMVLAIASDSHAPPQQRQRLWRHANICYEHSRVLACTLGDREGRLSTAHFDAILQRLQEEPASTDGTVSMQIDDRTESVYGTTEWDDKLTTMWRQRAEQAMALTAPVRLHTAASA